jgi:hypothetical protein
MDNLEGIRPNMHGLSAGPKDYKKFELKKSVHPLIKKLKLDLESVNMSDGLLLLFETRKIKFIVMKNGTEQKIEGIFLKDKLLNGWVIKGIDCDEFLGIQKKDL